MLMCGGLAGSTAAVFTTPFDVIKTRLQTQSALGVEQAVRYRGVGHAMRGILAKEGVGGLYRGITPRLLIYMSQGALFFASYEIIKQVPNSTLKPKFD